MRLRGKVAVVTGGAGSIGGGISRALAAEGAAVWVVDTSDEAGEEVVAEIRDAGGRADVARADLTSVDEASRAIGRIAEGEGRIDILVNNLGGSTGLGLEDLDEETFRWNIDLNLKSALFTTKAVCPAMRRNGRGSVVFISSINALLGGFGEVAYAAAKAGLHSLVATLTAEQSPQGLRFNALAVGSVPGNSPVWVGREHDDPGVLDRLARAYPLRRFGEPADVANAVVFLASDESSWITGAIIPVDGGLSATGGLPGGRWWTHLPVGPDSPTGP
jgi:meso-butanediol dehydrogenase/(S,S)-butanediol dehydrogenase/diacetyl reductase